jgi:PilZ domain
LSVDSPQEQRRSERMRLSVPVLVMTETREREQVQEETHTITVNAHGGLFRLRMEVLTGQPMIIVNVKTNQEQSCRVVRVLDMPEGDFGVAFEFDRPSPDFWCVTSPPADWHLVRS